MMKILISIFIGMYFLLFSSILEIQSLSQISDCQEEVLYFFDLDDTLFDSPSMLGSKTWRKHLLSQTKNCKKNWHDILTLFVARHYPVSTVEPFTAQYINKLQQKGHTVFGLTARERKIWYDTPTCDVDLLTVAQLGSVGIDLHSESSLELYPELVKSPEFFRGIFFADLDPKGEFLLKIFHNVSKFPKKVIFVDDKLAQVESVAHALEQLGIDFACYWYRASEEKAQYFDPLIANLELYFLWISNGKVVLFDHEAELFINQSLDAEYYLQTLYDNSL